MPIKALCIMFSACLFISGAMAETNYTMPMGLAYDPEHSSAYPSQMEAIFNTDFSTMTSKGFRAVRTYRTIFNNVQVAPYLYKFNMKMSLGVMLSDSNYAEQISAAVQAASDYPDHVKYIYIGNEDLATGSRSAEEIMSLITQVKSQLPSSSSVKVGTVQRTTEWVNKELMEGIAAVSDVLGVNVYSFFTPNTAIENSIEPLDVQMSQVTNLYDTPALITETGWASDGSAPVSGIVPSPANQALFFTKFHQSFTSSYQWSSSAYYENYYFQFCDTPYKSSALERSFGIFTSDNEIKPDLEGWIEQEIASFVVEQPVSVPVPATDSSVDKATPSPVPAAVTTDNSTGDGSNTSGSDSPDDDEVLNENPTDVEEDTTAATTTAATSDESSSSTAAIALSIAAAVAVVVVVLFFVNRSKTEKTNSSQSVPISINTFAMMSEASGSSSRSFDSASSSSSSSAALRKSFDYSSEL